MDEVMEGSDVTLQCNSVSRPDVSEYEWYKGETRLPDRGREMTVRNVTRDMEPYSCAARNTVGRGESALIQIPVPYAPTGVYISYIKNDHELVCDFRSSRPDVTHYTWMKDGSILHNETGKTLTIDNNGERYGRYSCIAHNAAGNSSSDEIHIQRDTVDLPLILGILAGVCFVLFCILLICIFLCRNKKSTVPNSPIHGTLSPRSPYNSTVATKENPYGNIQSENHMHPPSMRSGSSVDVNIEGNYVIYSNSELMEPTNEVEYCVIAQRQQNQIGLLSSRTNNADDVEYAILKR
ncbi:B-cell receptor CD22-like [Engystomops pustulosus]|uniref:B-cell receptor CD22-like n=1 Tax=Engystomops pustulosus TaxID=76066 RepID=UPI003AFB5FE1